jgi:hypothetical protein
VHAISQTDSCAVLESFVLRATFLFGKFVIDLQGIDAALFNKHPAEDSTMPASLLAGGKPNLSNVTGKPLRVRETHTFTRRLSRNINSLRMR